MYDILNDTDIICKFPRKFTCLCTVAHPPVLSVPTEVSSFFYSSDSEWWRHHKLHHCRTPQLDSPWTTEFICEYNTHSIKCIMSAILKENKKYSGLSRAFISLIMFSIFLTVSYVKGPSLLLLYGFLNDTYTDI